MMDAILLIERCQYFIHSDHPAFTEYQFEKFTGKLGDTTVEDGFENGDLFVVVDDR
jgi:hypothetical protein